MPTVRTKEIGIILTGIAVMSGLLLDLAFILEESITSLHVVILAAATFLTAAILPFALALVTTAAAVALIIAVCLLVVGIGGIAVETAIGALLMAVYLMVSIRHLRRAHSNSIKYRPVEIFHRGTLTAIHGIMIALISIAAPALVETVASEKFQVKEELVQRLLQPAEKAIQAVFPGYATHRSINDMLGAQLKPQQGVAFIEYEFSGDQTVAALIARSMTKKARETLATNRLLFSLAAIIIIALTVRAATPVIIWPVLGLIAVAVYLSRATGLVHLSSRTESVESLHL